MNTMLLCVLSKASLDATSAKKTARSRKKYILFHTTSIELENVRIAPKEIVESILQLQTEISYIEHKIDQLKEEGYEKGSYISPKEIELLKRPTEKKKK